MAYLRSPERLSLCYTTYQRMAKNMSEMLTPSFQRVQGFTVIEVLIVLAVTSLLFVLSLIWIPQLLNNTNSKIASNDFALAIQKSINDSLSSYLSVYSSLSCLGHGTETPVVFNSGSPGSSSGCIFLGSVLQLSPQGNPNGFIDYPIAGNQNFGATAAQNLAEAYPTAISVGGVIQTLDNYTNNNIGIKDVTADGNPTWAIGFVIGNLYDNLGAFDDSGNSTSSALDLNIYYVSGSSASESAAALTGSIPTNLVPASSVVICLDLYNGYYDAINISGSGNLIVSSTIESGGSSC
jgi:prepilin-type N-terminal cleavage/methylation domain-containing protein